MQSNSLSTVTDCPCGVCNVNQTVESSMESTDIGNKFLKRIYKLCYHQEIIEPEGGADGSFIARDRNGWKTFRQLIPLLTMGELSLHMKSILYVLYYMSCVGNAVL